VPRHAHENDRSPILEWDAAFLAGRRGERELIVRTGEVLVIPSNLPHRAVALENTLGCHVFNPPRQDWSTARILSAP